MMRSSRIAYAPLQSEVIDERSKKKTDEFDAVELRARGRGRGRKSDDEDSHPRSDSAGSSNGTVYIERIIQDGDTLQKIALQYSIQVAELKRANNLLSEQDFYGLKLLRIPVNKYSSVHETAVDEQQQVPSTSSAIAAPLPITFQLTEKLVSISDDDEPSSSMHDRALASSSWRSGDGSSSPHKDFEELITKVDASLQLAREKADHLERTTQLEETHSFHFIDATEPKSAHWYTSPWILVVLVVLIFVVVPLWVTVYEQRLNNEKHTEAHSTRH